VIRQAKKKVTAHYPYLLQSTPHGAFLPNMNYLLGAWSHAIMQESLTPHLLNGNSGCEKNDSDAMREVNE